MLNGIEFGKRLEECLEKAKISNAEITKALNLNKNAIGNYKNGQIPNAVYLYEISNYLGISMEYLLTGQNSLNLTPEEQYLIDIYRRADDRGKRNILRLVQGEDQEAGPPASGTGFANIGS